MSVDEDDRAFDSTLPGIRASGPVVAAAKRRVLAGLFGGDERPSQAGRFELRKPLGYGAFGVVWRAFDPMLQREVAIKIVERHLGSGGDAMERFLREARAVASLSHPNVVQVFDYGVLDGAPFLAMELVEGGSLEGWLRELRPWSEVVPVFVGAARGLAAAHAVGLVHRDFKPANVLLGVDGRPRVADFGLAVLVGQGERTTASGVTAQPGSATLTTPFAGTPAYMAPEQHEGREVDARTDVYALCASLYAALQGRMPFDVSSLLTLADAKLHLRLVEPLDPRLPAWLRRVVLRGLAPDPADRWPSMDALAHALEHPPSGGRRRMALLGAGLAVVVAALAVPRDEPDPCPTTAQARIDERWSDAARQQVQQALSSRAGLGADVTARLDDHAARWLAARQQACTALPGPRLDATVGCLDRGLASLGATVDRLRAAEGAGLDRARDLVRQLDDPDRCDRLAVGASAAPPDATVATEVAAIREQLAVLEVTRRAGSLAGEVEAARALSERAMATGFAPVQAEAALLLGRAQQAAGDFEPAVAQCERAHLEASRIGDDATALESALCVTRIRGVDLGPPEQGLEWARRAAAALERAGRPELEAGRLEDLIATIHWAQRDAAQALPHHDRAIELYRRASTPAPRLLAASLNNRANVLADLGRNGDAVASQREAIEILTRELGPEHLQTAGARCTLGSLLGDIEDPAAVTELDAGLAILARALPPDHPWRVQSQANLGLTLRVLGDRERARTEMEAALAAAQTVPGAVGVDLRVGIGSNLTDLLEAMGDPAAARLVLETTRRVARDELGPEDPRSLLLAIRTALAMAPTDPAAAARELEDVIATASAHDQPDSAAMARFELARLVRPTDPDRARSLAEGALDHWRTRAPGRTLIAPFPRSVEQRASEIETWLIESGSNWGHGAQ